MEPELFETLPPEWLAFATEWAPYVLGTLVLTTAAAHLLLPLARKLETWAVVTAATWDDGLTRWLVVALEWVVATSRTLMEWLPIVARAGAAREPAPRPERVSRPPSDGALALVLVVLAAVMSVVTSGCGMAAVEAGRHVLAGTARVSAQLDRDLAAERVRVSEEIRARADATREEHDEAMRPFDEALEITVDVRAAHLAAQEALDAAEHGEAKDWRPLMTCVFSSASRLIGLATRHVEVPAEAGVILQALAELAEGKCPEPKRAEGGEQ